MSFANVISGAAIWHAEAGDCIKILEGLPEDSVDLTLFSPPYENARSYSIGFKLRDQAWVDWMVQVFTAASRVCKGLVACVCEGVTRNYRWSATPALLLADLHRAGFVLRKPPIFHRVGIPGSGGPDWLRNDYELIVCATRKGKLPWSSNTACGHPPKWAPGGAMSHRMTNGERVNQWGGRATSGGQRRANGKRQKSGRPSHQDAPPKGRRVSRGSKNGDTLTSDSYEPPVLANPGNVIHGKVGGGLMGHALAHKNEAPYPEWLTEFFIRSFCPPGGIVLDPFLGSGTTIASALKWGRRGIGCDIRQDQIDITRERIDSITPMLPMF